ncbi:MAG TPA: hypothetical protein VFS33_10510 [Gemmatimonadales bacterium]|nr:hypothetical protein [Gemmatimonadales bacterium]
MDDVMELEKRVGADMLAKHNIALGCWGVPDGATYTFTRAEFYRRAFELGVIDDVEYHRIRARNSLIWHRDLSD